MKAQVTVNVDDLLTIMAFANISEDVCGLISSDKETEAFDRLVAALKVEQKGVTVELLHRVDELRAKYAIAA